MCALELIFETAIVPAACWITAQYASDCILRNSVKSRMEDCKHGDSDQRALELLHVAKKQKKVAFHRSILLTFVTLVIGQVSIWAHPSRQGWRIHAPGMLAWGAKTVYLVFFTTLDDIQDEVAPLGRPSRRDLFSPSILAICPLFVLLKTNKMYHVEAIQLLVGTVIAQTTDTVFWKFFAVGAILVCTLLIFTAKSAVGPSTPDVALITGGFCLVSIFYEKICASGNPLRSPPWLVRAAEAGMLQYGIIWFFSLVGIYPAGLLLPTMAYYLGYYRLKIRNFSMCTRLIRSLTHPDFNEIGPAKYVSNANNK